jgi:hypothetical protein
LIVNCRRRSETLVVRKSSRSSSLWSMGTDEAGSDLVVEYKHVSGQVAVLSLEGIDQTTGGLTVFMVVRRN